MLFHSLSKERHLNECKQQKGNNEKATNWEQKNNKKENKYEEEPKS